MKVQVRLDGKLRDASMIAAVDEYRKRFRRFGSLELVEVSGSGKRPTGLWPTGNWYRVLCDEQGRQWSSRTFAGILQQWIMQHGPVVIAIGAADGHLSTTRAQAQASWSLGPLTLPHQLAVVVVFEQLYRAAGIQAGTSYHRD